MAGRARVAAAADGSARAAAAPRAAAERARACGRATSSRTPRAATLDRARRSRARRRSRAGRRRAGAGRAGTAPPWRLGVDLVAQPAQRRPQQQAAELARAALDVAALADRAQQRVRRSPSITFSATLPVKPSVDDHVGRARADREALDVADEARAPPRRSASAAWAATTSSVPLRRAPRRWRAAPRAGAATPITTSMNAAPMCANWTRCSGRTSTLAPASSSRNGRAGHGHERRRAPGRWTPRRALDAEQRRRRAPRRWSRRRRARRRGRRRRPATACTIEASGVERTARAGSAALAIETGASTTSTPGAGAELARRGRRAARATPRSAASAAPRATSAGPRSAPLASTRDP